MIPTTNIVMALSKEAINKYFTAAEGFPSLLKDSKADDDLLVFNNVSNPNFISLKHDFKGERSEIQLEFIDPNREFESRLITGNVTDLLGSVFGQEPVDQEFGPHEVARINVEKKNADEYEEFYNTYMQRMLKKAGVNTLYIAYGVGNNLDHWAGPFICTITDIKVQIKGNRKFIMSLTPGGMSLGPSGRRGLFTAEANMNLEGMNYVVKGYSAPFAFNNLLNGTVDDSLFWFDDQRPRVYQSELFDLDAVPEGVDQGLSKQVEQQRNSEFLNRGQFAAQKLVKDIDFHLIITDIIRDYIRKVTRNPNVIVLLPDLNVILADHIQEEASNNAAVFVDPTAAPAQIPEESAGLFDIVTDLDDDYFRTYRIPWLFFYSVARSVLNSFGFTFEAFNIANWNRSALSPPEIAVEEDKNFGNYQDRTEKYVLDQVFLASLTTQNKKIPNHKEALDKILSDIWSSSKGQQFSKFVVANFFESDVNLLRYWEEINSPAFGGARKFTSSKAAVVYGDRELINQYLYGGDGTTVSYTAPLHPLDAACFHKSYREEVSDIISYKGIEEDGPFGDPTFLPDDFMHVENELVQNPQLKKDLIKNNIPVFRYHTSNPNVSEIKANFGPEYFAQLQVSIEKAVERRAATNFGGAINSRYSAMNLKKPEDIIAYITSRHMQLGSSSEAKEKIAEELKTKFTAVRDDATIDPEQHAKAYMAYYRELLNRPDQPLIRVAQAVDADPASIVADMAEQLYRTAIQIDIKTLPSFYISNYSNIGKPLLLLAQDTGVKKTTANRSTILDTFFSGLYTIVGFSHTISSAGAESSFNLVKMISKANDGPIESDDNFEYQE